MSLESEYETLFGTLQRIADAEPQQVPQLLAVVLAGGPFRPFLDRPELLTRAVVTAKQYVAEKKRAGAAAPRPGRVVSLRDVAPARKASKA